MDPSSEIVCTLLWIYSMESFVYKQLNAATRDHDPAFVNTLGPMCKALYVIVGSAESERPVDSTSLSNFKHTDLYRGLSLPDDIVQQYKDLIGEDFHMGGFSSTSLDLPTSIGFALRNQSKGNTPVLMHI